MSDKDEKVTIKYSKKGTIKVRGAFTLYDEHGNQLKAGKQKVTLCGCGLSEEMPICDGSHKKLKKNKK